MKALRFLSLWAGSRLVQSFNGFAFNVSLLTATFGLALAAHGQTIPDPNFGDTTFSVFPGYASVNDSIPGWTLSNASYIGLNPVFMNVDPNPFADNGAIPVGPNVAFIQSLNNTNTLSTTITGLTVGQFYAVSFRANCRAATGTPNPTWSLNGGAFVAFTAAPPVGAANPYYTNTGYFTASSTTAALALRNGTTADTTVLVDAFSIGLAPLATANLLVGPAASSNSVVLVAATPGTTWTATSHASWLHLTAPNQSGTGSTNVIFSFDANAGATRAGTLTIAGQPLTVTQAGSTYVAATPLTTLVPIGLPDPFAVALDGVGNVYIADDDYRAIMEWTATNNMLSSLVSGAGAFLCVALDGAGNIYFGAPGAVKKWTASGGAVSTLVTNLNTPSSLAVDRAGNVYIADNGNNAIYKWSVADSAVTTVVSNGLNYPSGVGVDGAGNIYIGDAGHNAIKKWTAANSNVTALVSSGLNAPWAVSVDGSGNLYIADAGDDAIKKWTATTGILTPLASGLVNYPFGAAVDGAGNVYLSDNGDAAAVKELPYAFVDPSAKTEPAAAGSDALVILPASVNLLAPFVPTSDSSWLTVGAASNGVVNISFTANFTTNSSAGNRLGHINVLGVSVPVSQAFIMVTPPKLIAATILGNGQLRFNFTNNPSATFTVLMSTNLALPLADWAVVGAATNIGADVFQFTDSQTTNSAQRFYTVRAP